MSTPAVVPPVDQQQTAVPVAGQAPTPTAVPVPTPAPAPVQDAQATTDEPIYGDYPENAALFAIPDGMNHPDQLVQYFDTQAEVDAYLQEQATKSGKAFERVVVFEGEAAAPAATPVDQVAATQTQAPAPTPAPVQDALPQDVLEAQAATAVLQQQHTQLSEKLGALTDQRQELETKYGNGDLSDDEYEEQVAALDGQYTAINKQAEQVEASHAQYKLKIDTFNQMQVLQLQQAFTNDMNAFMARPENNIFTTSEIHADAFRKEFARIDALPESQSLSNEQVLQKTRDALAKVFVLPSGQAPAATQAPAPTPTAKPAQAKPVDVPITLDQLQTSVANDVGNPDPYAHIRDLQGQAYQDAISKMTEAQREAMLLSFG